MPYVVLLIVSMFLSVIAIIVFPAQIAPASSASTSGWSTLPLGCDEACRGVACCPGEDGVWDPCCDLTSEHDSAEDKDLLVNV
eukprot:CAMPEP_0194513086 /NCGR_PEP_ID=MMETSP0253-20130528/45264_1 /TAXON_ID=2966 /ORGANISM="Noctiluca scintillans" /LENGTH=82 /DNA_ID=CAMNT_0039356607 /DNA_START=36 /DNA_END=284 /DNA_ORIENTATION=+